VGAAACQEACLHLFVGFGTLIWEIESPVDARIYQEPGNVTKWKADQVILKNIVIVEEFFVTHLHENLRSCQDTGNVLGSGEERPLAPSLCTAQI
jgi:hypothetical protein